MKYIEKSVYDTLNLQDECFDPLTTEQEAELLKRYKENKDMDAKEELIRRNLRFVNKVVINIFGTMCAEDHKFEISTLFQEGVIGLIEGLEYFDINRGFKFLTYSYYRILKHTWLYVYNNTSSMSGCLSLFRDYTRINNILKKNPNLTYEEISDKLNNFRSPKSVENVIKIVESKTSVPVYDHIVSSEGEEHSLIEISISTSVEEAIYNEIHNNELKELINKILYDDAIFSNDRARNYFIEYFINGKSYREIGQKYKVSHQAVQQSVQKRLEYVKKNYGHLLMEFYN